jgi:hypothetical protein
LSPCPFRAPRPPQDRPEDPRSGRIGDKGPDRASWRGQVRSRSGGRIQHEDRAGRSGRAGNPSGPIGGRINRPANRWRRSVRRGSPTPPPARPPGLPGGNRAGPTGWRPTVPAAAGLETTAVTIHFERRFPSRLVGSGGRRRSEDDQPHMLPTLEMRPHAGIFWKNRGEFLS